MATIRGCALIIAVAGSVIDDLSTELEDVDREAREHEKPGDGLVGLAATYRAFAQAHPEGFRLMFTASAPARSTTADVTFSRGSPPELSVQVAISVALGASERQKVRPERAAQRPLLPH